MPHFIIDTCEKVLRQSDAQSLMRGVHDAANSSGLFDNSVIKVRIRPFDNYLVDGVEGDFIHVFGNIMQGRTDEQKADLSRRIVSHLKTQFPDCPVVSMNIRDFERASYNNLDSV